VKPAIAMGSSGDKEKEESSFGGWSTASKEEEVVNAINRHGQQW